MNNSQPTQIIILGGSGDLAKRKLIPALIDLYTHNKLPEVFSIVGLARTPRTDAEYQAFVAESLEKHGHRHSREEIESFCKHFSYVSGSFDEEVSYTDLEQAINTFETGQTVRTNKLFYLAVPPEYYETIFKNLHTSGLTKIQAEGRWTRILVEKPFGHNLKTAQRLDKTLGALFAEEQIFRIDHYLAKEAVQNILSFRFANTLLRSPWNAQHIKEVSIKMHEEIDVENRGDFYDAIGALRDVGQNHLLQLLALVAMNEPATFTATDIRKERAKVLKDLIPVTHRTISKQVSRAQYEGYLETTGVEKNSETETFFSFTAYLKNKKWKGVPFHIEAGKAMSERSVVIDITFKDVASGPFETHTCNTVENKVTLTLSPEQAMHITINAKKPGHGYQLESQTLSFVCTNEGGEIDAYEKVLLDCIEGDQTLFTKTDEVMASWRFITSIIENWQAVPLRIYKKGTAGPVQ
jgi:glucose-6-phosphate 1-dehydrogenase